MTKKHHEIFATLVGSYRDEIPAELIDDIVSLLFYDNNRFDPERFRSWVDDVAEGRRNKHTGKKIKPKREGG